jgi:hypothetical protein
MYSYEFLAYNPYEICTRSYLLNSENTPNYRPANTSRPACGSSLRAAVYTAKKIELHHSSLRAKTHTRNTVTTLKCNTSALTRQAATFRGRGYLFSRRLAANRLGTSKRLTSSHWGQTATPVFLHADATHSQKPIVWLALTKTAPCWHRPTTAALCWTRPFALTPKLRCTR